MAKHHHHPHHHREKDDSKKRDKDTPAAKKAAEAEARKRTYSMKIIPQVGSVEHIDWGWSNFKDDIIYLIISFALSH